MKPFRYWKMERMHGSLWLYTPTRATAYFGAGGWVYLNARWLWTKGRDEYRRRQRVAKSRGAPTQEGE